jgi:hypothetical protein
MSLLIEVLANYKNRHTCWWTSQRDREESMVTWNSWKRTRRRTTCRRRLEATQCCAHCTRSLICLRITWSHSRKNNNSLRWRIITLNHKLPLPRSKGLLSNKWVLGKSFSSLYAIQGASYKKRKRNLIKSNKNYPHPTIFPNSLHNP